MPHPASIITLLTDFGDRDWFVASMKGVILSINAQATIVDLSHRIASHDVEDGAYAWKSCYKYFPEGTIHVAVVDPGVGSDRRPLIAKSPRFFFCAPDNGLVRRFTPNETPDDQLIEQMPNEYFPHSRIRVFFQPARLGAIKNVHGI